MKIRKANLSDLPRLMEIYREARQIQLDSGNLHQWREGYPSEEIVRGDIDREVSYVVEEGGEVVGAFAFIPGVDPLCATVFRKRVSVIVGSSIFSMATLG